VYREGAESAQRARIERKKVLIHGARAMEVRELEAKVLSAYQLIREDERMRGSQLSSFRM
jgi:hypothetical protein